MVCTQILLFRGNADPENYNSLFSSSTNFTSTNTDILLPLSVSNVVIVQMLWHVLLTVKHSSILETKEMACRNIPLEDADATSHRPNLLLLLLLLCSTCSSIVVITIIIIFNSRHVSN